MQGLNCFPARSKSIEQGGIYGQRNSLVVGGCPLKAVQHFPKQLNWLEIQNADRNRNSRIPWNTSNSLVLSFFVSSACEEFEIQENELLMEIQNADRNRSSRVPRNPGNSLVLSFLGYFSVWRVWNPRKRIINGDPKCRPKSKFSNLAKRR
jgi:hypothetical protein